MKGPGIKVNTPATLTGPEPMYQHLGIALEEYYLEVFVRPGTGAGLQVKTFASKGIFDTCPVHPMQIGAETILSHLDINQQEVNLDLHLYIRMTRIDGLGIHEAAAVAGACAIIEIFDLYLEKETMLELLCHRNEQEHLGWREICLATSLLGGLRIYHGLDSQYRLPLPSGIYLAILTPHRKQGKYLWPNYADHLAKDALITDSVRWGILTFGLFQSNFEAIDTGLKIVPAFIETSPLKEIYSELISIGASSNMLGYPHINRGGNILYALFPNTLDAEVGGEGLQKVLSKHNILTKLDILSINQAGADKM